MRKEIEIAVSPQQKDDRTAMRRAAVEKLNISEDALTGIRLLRRSIDARQRMPRYRILVEAFVDEPVTEDSADVEYRPVQGDKEAVIIGFGPTGMFAALRLIQEGIKPVVFERGKDVRRRRRDLRNLQQLHIVDPDSNYCFGEGGAGTFSDGKLYTRSHKRGNVRKVLELLVQHGAHQDILIDAHPHIGSNKLPKIVEAIRETILANGGEIHFESRVTDIIIDNGKVRGIVVNEEREVSAEAVILSTGHSARDIFELLQARGVALEAKPFALGVRIEHPQELINKLQYKSGTMDGLLPAASYNLSCQVGDRGVFSFCMCPGGIIIPASTAPGELVLNGMSISRRDSRWANSGLVVTVGERDFQRFASEGPLAGLALQREVEALTFEAAGRSQRAPSQRVTDFLNNKDTKSLPETSYIPGVQPGVLREMLPVPVVKGMVEALREFEKRRPGYITEEAQMLAVESRTSSPVRIPRDKETRMHIGVEGLFPAGEGAGYAGGIVSAAVDGENTAAAVALVLKR